MIRSLAVALCYTIVRGALATNPIRRAAVPNHCGFGVVEAVGPMVKRVIDSTSVITKRYTLDQSRQAVQDTADRSVITPVIEFS